MMINFSPVKSFYKINSVNRSESPVRFCGGDLPPDTFEKSSLKKGIRVFNPYSNSFCKDDVDIDLSKPLTFKLTNNEQEQYKDSHLIVDYHPDRFGYLRDKINDTPIKAKILFSKINELDSVFNFMSEDLEKCYGYVYFTKLINPEFIIYYGCRNELIKDWYDEEIIGTRLCVTYLENFDEKTVGGIGNLSDKMLVKYCLDNNMPVNIVSEADTGSHVAHFLRGRRFFELNDSNPHYNFYMNKYGTVDINSILNKLIQKAKQTGESVNLKGWGVEAMYMPKEIVEKYINELTCNPIP